VGAKTVVFVHPSGLAALPVEAVTNVIVRLEGWGSLTGVLMISGQPAPGVEVATCRWTPPSSDHTRLYFSDSTTTDEHGRFRFDRVPPGALQLTNL
jgi:hypothetical protein